MKTVIYPGSFDPVTNGHLDIIARAAASFDELIVGVLHNKSKNPMFTVEERVDLLREVAKGFDNVRVVSFTGLLVDYLKENNIKVIIKGLRAISDFEIEFQMALVNKKLQPDTETLFMASKAEYSYLSSSVVKEVHSFGGDISGLVPPLVAERLKNKLLEV